MGKPARRETLDKADRRETTRMKKQKSGYGAVIPFHEDKAKTVTPLNDKQRILISTILANTLTFATGCAGTGKSYIGIAVGIKMLLNHEVEQLILTTPDWCVGKGMGIVPGGPEEKTAILFSTMREACTKILGASRLENEERLKKIRFLHLSEALGKTFDDAVVVMDEAQVSSCAEMKVLLTRIGHRSKIILCGDHREQAYRGTNNGLEDALKRFQGAPEVGRVNFTLNDVVRSDFCKTVIKSYRDRDVDEEELEEESN